MHTQKLLVASLLLVVWPGAPFVASLLLVAMPFAPFLASSTSPAVGVRSATRLARVETQQRILHESLAGIERGGALNRCEEQEAPGTRRVLVTSSFLLLVLRPGAPSSILAPSSDALCY